MSDESHLFILNIDNSKKDIQTGERQLNISQMELKQDEKKKINARERAAAKDPNTVSAPQAPTKISHINIGIDFDNKDNNKESKTSFQSEVREAFKYGKKETRQ